MIIAHGNVLTTAKTRTSQNHDTSNVVHADKGVNFINEIGSKKTGKARGIEVYRKACKTDLLSDKLQRGRPARNYRGLSPPPRDMANDKGW